MYCFYGLELDTGVLRKKKVEIEERDARKGWENAKLSRLMCC